VMVAIATDESWARNHIDVQKRKFLIQWRKSCGLEENLASSVSGKVWLGNNI